MNYGKKLRPAQEKTIDTWLGETFKANRNKIAIVDDINRITYGDLEKKINQYGGPMSRFSTS